MFQVYIIKSTKLDNKYYIGSAEDAKRRLNFQHNKGKVKSTKAYLPWEIIYTENFETRSEAVRRERQIKSYKGGEAFKRLIQSRSSAKFEK
jgi:putative endonuclease